MYPYVPRLVLVREDLSFYLWHICGLNEVFRFAKYPVGTQFQPHVDAHFVRHNSEEMSFYTVNMFLNDAFRGGKTRFYSGQRASEVTVQARDRVAFDPESDSSIVAWVPGESGTATIFRQPPGAKILHDGEK